jgi:hypothetical protein
MKTVKAMCAATLLALSLSIPAYADTAPGDQHTPGKVCPAPIPTTSPDGLPPAEVGGISLSAFVDIVWALASIF